MAAGVCLPTKARWYPWNTLNLMSLTSWCCANALWILNYSTQFYVCNKSSIKTCKDFGNEQRKEKQFFGSVTRSSSFSNFFFLLHSVCCWYSFLWLFITWFLSLPEKKSKRRMNNWRKKQKSLFWCICMGEFFYDSIFPRFSAWLAKTEDRTTRH